MKERKANTRTNKRLPANESAESHTPASHWSVGGNLSSLRNSFVLLFFLYWSFWDCKKQLLVYLLLTLCHEEISVVSPTLGRHYHGGRLTFYVSAVWIVVLNGWTQERTGFSEGVSFGSHFQHVVAKRLFSWVNWDMETANCCSSSDTGCVLVWGAGSHLDKWVYYWLAHHLGGLDCSICTLSTSWEMKEE